MMYKLYMKIIANRLEIEKYLETKETNILVNNIINDYLENFAHDEHETMDEESLYENMLEELEIDPLDKEFKRLAKAYSLNVFSKLDLDKYLNNPYVKNIKFADIKFKNYELSTDFYYPYELFVASEVTVDSENYYKETNKLSYFDTKFNYLALKEGGKTWMSLIPHEIETMDEDIKRANGNVLVLGLGLGYFSYMISEKEDVKSVTIIEKDENIINLFTRNILNQFKHKEKIIIIKEDAINFLKKDIEKYNFVYCDLYHDPFDALPPYISIKNIENNHQNIPFRYWIEESILCLIRRLVLTIIEETFENYTDKDYKNASDYIDKLINKIYFKTKKDVINGENELKIYLSNENLKKIILD